MATLTDDEMARLRAELGAHVLANSATPMVGVLSIWAVIRDSVVSSSVSPTTSATTVSTAGPVVLTLASATGYVAGQSIQLDCDAERETVTIRNLSGSNASVICRKAHSGTYPVEVESPLTIVRGLLSDLRRIEQGDFLAAFDALGVKQVDEIILSDAGQLKFIDRARAMLRDKLATACGVPSFASTTQRMEPY